MTSACGYMKQTSMSGTCRTWTCTLTHTTQEWDKIWAINKRLIDPVCPRHTSVVAEGRVLVTLSGAPQQPEVCVCVWWWGGGVDGSEPICTSLLHAYFCIQKHTGAPQQRGQRRVSRKTPSVQSVRLGYLNTAGSPHSVTVCWHTTVLLKPPHSSSSSNSVMYV
jgi:hypothetical protein